MHQRVPAAVIFAVLAMGSITACSAVVRTMPGPANPVAPASPTAGSATTTTSGGAAATGSTAAARTTSGSGEGAGYAAYRNERFGFSVAVPSSFTAGTPPQNGDGMTFSPQDHRVTLRVFGANNVLGETPASAAAAFVAEQKSKHSRVTLNSVKGDHFTVSGYDSTGTTVWYEHKIVLTNVEYAIDWEYPASLASQIDPQVTATVHSYVAGPDSAG